VSIPVSPPRCRAVAALLTVVLAALVLPAAAPARVPTYHVGDRVTFTASTRGAHPASGAVYLHVATKRSFDRYGQLKQTRIGTFAQMHRKGPSLYKYTTPPYTFDTWFMQRPGTYYWQTQFTDCAFKGCQGHGSVRVFKVT
jgi:hypothetical protein